MKRRVISAFLLIVMLISLFPVQAFAAETTEDDSAVLSDVENSETTQSDNDVPGEEVEILPMPEPEYEEVSEEESTEDTDVKPTENPAAPIEAENQTKSETEGKAEDEASEETDKNDAEAAEETSEKVSVRFNLTPADLTLKVYPADEAQAAEAILPEEDGSYLLSPGEYYYDAECDGYISALGIAFTVTESAAIDVTLEKDSMMSVMATSSSGVVASGTCGTNATWTLDSSYTLTIKGSGAMKDYDDESYQPWKTYITKIKNITINSGITSIGEYAFYGCSSASEAHIPLSVTSIGFSAFRGCSSLTWICPSNAASIGNCAFMDCSNLKFVDISGSLTSIGRSVFSGCSSLTDITIPEGVTSIDVAAFSGCSSLTSVTIPDNVTTIGIVAFSGCSSLTSVTIGSSVTSFSFNEAFSNCNNLTDINVNAGNEYYSSIDGVLFKESATKLYYFPRGRKGEYVIPNGVTSISNYAFEGCSGLTSVTMPDSVTSIGTSAFSGCNGLTSVTIPNGVTSISESAFKNCSGLTNVTIPDSVTSIGGSAFSGCSGLTMITMADSVASIGVYAFSGCSGLKDLYYLGTEEMWNTLKTKTSGSYSGNDFLINAALHYIYIASGTCGDNMTWTLHENGVLTISGTGKMNDYAGTSSNRAPWETYNTQIIKLLINSGVTSIGNYAFEGCSSLTSVTISDSVTSIGNSAFRNCSSFTSVAIPDSVTSIGYYAFCNCYNLVSVTIGNNVTSIDNSTFEGCGSLTSVTIPDSVTSICNSAFSGCGSLTSVTIPDSVTSIGYFVFYKCNNLTDINVDTENKYYSSIKGVVFNKSATTLCFFPNGRKGEYIIPSSVTSIEASAFYGCSSLISVTIPEGVTTIGTNAFSGCSSLASATIPDGVTGVLDYTFCNCSNLTNVTIPGSVTSIGNRAFYGCSSLTSITIPDSVTSIGDDAFHGCSCLTDINVDSENDYYSSIGGVVFNKSATTLYLFPNGRKGEYIIPNSVTNIESYTFYRCYSLTSVTIPDSVTSIGDDAFSGCSSLTSVTIPDSVTNIGNCAFYNCTGLVSVTIPEGVTSIGNSVFYGCSSLTSIMIPDGVTTIDDSAFYSCSSLTSLTIPDSVTNIYYGAFYGCSSLKDVYFLGSEEMWSTLKTAGISAYNEPLENAILHCCSAFGNCGDNITWMLDSAGMLTIIGMGRMTSNPWNMLHESITTIEIKAGVTNIIGEAFADCSKLTCLILPDSVVSIGDRAFYNCAGLVNATIPEGVTSIGNSVFFGCSSLANITVPDGVTSIGDSAFSDCSALANITIPESVTSIGNSAFSGCSSLTGGSIPDGITSIDSNVFSNCAALASITIPESVTSIGVDAFSGCTALKDVYYSGSQLLWNTVSIGLRNSALTDATKNYGRTTESGTCGENITWALDLSGKLTITGNGAMADYSDVAAPWNKFKADIKSAEIASGVTTIGSSAFSDCAVLTSVTIPESVTTIGDNAFAGCTALDDVRYSGSQLLWNKITIGDGNTALTDAAKNYGRVTESGACGEGITWTLDLSGKLTINGSGAMADYSDGSAPWDKFKADIKSVEIESGVTAIGNNAFSGCTALASVTIPESVTNIGSFAFSGCGSLTSVTIPDGVTAIGDSAFSGCSVLASATIPESVTSVGDSAFSGCAALEDVYYSGSQLLWDMIAVGDGNTALTGAEKHYGRETESSACGDDISWTLDLSGKLTIDGSGAMTDYSGSDAPWDKFKGNIKNIEIKSGVTDICNNAFSGCESLTSVTIPDSVTSIGEGAFSGCGSLTSVTIPNGVTSIGDSAFSNCSSLTSVTIPESVSSIGSSAFSGCGSLTNITIPNGVTSIGEDAFSDCTALTSVTIPGSVTSIGDSCFSGCGSLTSVTIPDGVTNIGSNVFSNCAALASITIPESLTSIGDGAFSGCAALEDVYYPGSQLLWNTISIGTGNSALTDAVKNYGRTTESGRCGENITWTLNLSGALTIDGSGAMADYTNGTEPWNRCKSSIKSVVIKSGVTAVGKNVFSGCTALTSATIPESVTSIGSSAFYGCSKLKSVSYPGSQLLWNTISIGTDNSPLTSATKNYGRTTESGRCGENISWTLNLSGKLTISGNGAMTDYSAGTAPWDKFKTVIKSAEIKSGVTTIGSYALSGCSALTSVSIPESVTSIEGSAFYGCSALTSLTIPESVTCIGNSAFYGCSKLRSVYYPGSQLLWNTISIGANNSTLTNAAKTYSRNTESGTCGGKTTWSLTLSGALTITGSGAMADYSDGSAPWNRCKGSVKSIEIKSGVTGIGSYAFSGCTALTSVTMPESVTSIGDGAFADCAKLENVCYPGSQLLWDLISVGNNNSVLTNAAKNYDRVTESGTCGDKLTWTLDLSGKLTIDGSGAMADYSVGSAPWNKFKAVIKSAEIESGVTYVGSYAFSNCPVLAGISIPESVTSIGDGAFADCAKLENVCYPGSQLLWDLISIGDNNSALINTAKNYGRTTESGTCGDKLTWTLDLSGKLTIGGSGAMADYSDGSAPWNKFNAVIKSAEIESGMTYVGSYAFSNCPVLAGISIPESVTSIGDGAFADCAKLENVCYPGSQLLWDLVSVDNNNSALTNATKNFGRVTESGTCGDKLTWTLDLSGKLTVSGSGAMTDYSGSDAPWDKFKANIKSAEIKSGVTYVGNNAFSGCAVLKNIIISDSVTNIGDRAFSGCSSLSGAVIPSSVTDIGSSVFSGCALLTSATIPVAVKNIGENAFAGCTNLADVYYGGTSEDWSAIVINSGNECLTRAGMHSFVDLELSVDREYISVQIGDDTAAVTAKISPARWADYLTWSAENPAGKEIISVNSNGEITPLAVGTAYVIATVSYKNYSFNARCRVDVTENPTADEISGVQLGATSVTSELYSRDYAEFDIVLLLERSWEQSSVADSSVPTADDDKPVDNGVAIENARFTDIATEALFDLVVVDDRRVAVVPKGSSIDNAKSVKGSYTSAVEVTVSGEKFETASKLKLTVKKTQPKLKANVAAFNSFYSGQSAPIVITGATVTAIAMDTSKKNADWLTLDAESKTLTLNEKAPLKSASGSVYLNVYTDEWAIPASVTVSVKNAYKAPKLKFSSSSVKVSSVSSTSVEMQLLSSAKNETLKQHNVTKLKASGGYDVKGFDPTTGAFTLTAPEGAKSGKITLYVGFSDTKVMLPLTLSVQSVAPAVKLKTTSVTLNPDYNDSADVDVAITPLADYTGKGVCKVLDAKGKSVDKTELEVDYKPNGKLHIQTVKGTKYNSTYKVVLAITNTDGKIVSGTVTLTIKTTKENVKPTSTVKTSGAIDLTYPESAVIITPTFKNYGGCFELLGGTVTETKGKDVVSIGSIDRYFNAKVNDNTLTLTKQSGGKQLTVGNTYTAALRFAIGGDNSSKETLTTTAKITVKQTAVNLKLSKSSVTLNMLYGDSAVIGITSATKNYELDSGKMLYKITSTNLVNGTPLDVSYLDGKLYVRLNDNTRYDATYKVQISADAGYKPTTLTVKVPAKAKSTVTVTLKAKGSIDTIRDDTKIVFAPTYKNTVSAPVKERIEVYSSDGKKVHEADGLELTNFGAVSTAKYKAKIVATFENGQTVSSPLIAITVKTGTAKMKATGTPTLYLKDKNSRGKFTLTSTDLTLNAIKDIEDGGIEIKDQKYKDMFKLYDYGNGQYAIGFKDSEINDAAAKLKSVSIPINIRHEGNNTAKPDATVTLKVTIVK